MIKCKFGCEGGHPTAVCPKYSRKAVAQRVASIEAQPKPVPGSRPKKKKAKKKAKAKKPKPTTTGVPE